MSARCLITVGVDGSIGGRRALAWAIRHGAAANADVEVVTAHNWVGVAFESASATGPRRAASPDGGAAEARHGAGARRVRRHAAHPVAHLVEGDPVDVLTSAARNSDLLVLGSHGQGRLGNALLGSVSEGCVRRGTTPVLIVPAQDPRS